MSGFSQPAHSLRNTIQNNFCRALTRRRGRLARKAKSCWRRAKFSRMRPSRERKTLINQPMRCRSHEIIVQNLIGNPATSRLQLIHFPSALGFDERQGSDPADDSTKLSAGKVQTDYTKFLKVGSLKGARIGIARDFSGRVPETNRVTEESIATLKKLGAVIVDPVRYPAYLLEIKQPLFI